MTRGLMVIGGTCALPRIRTRTGTSMRVADIVIGVGWVLFWAGWLDLTALAAPYRRLIVRKGKKRTIVAVAHSMLIIAYYLLKRQCTYQDLGSDYFNLRNEDAITHRLVKKLTGLGYHVTLQLARAEAGSETA